MPIPTFKFNNLTRTDLLQFDGVNFVNVPVYAVGKNVMWGSEEFGYSSLLVGDITKNISLVGHKHTINDILGLKEFINDLVVNSNSNSGTSIDLSNYLLTSTFIDHLNNINSAKHVTQAHLDKLNNLNNYWQLDDQGNLYTTYNTYSTKGLSAFGLGEDGEGGGTGGGGVDMLDSWENYTEAKANFYAPASLLVSFRNDTLGRLTSLELGGSGGGGSTVTWGTAYDGYIPLTVDDVTETLALSAHNHSGVYERAFSNPTVNGYLLSSTTAGTRSWVKPYELPIANASVLGGVKIGTNVSISSGVISVHNPLTIGTANGLSLSNQQLSLALADTTKNGALSADDKVYINLLRTFFEHDTTNNAIKALKPFYSVGEVSAYGLGSGGSSGGGTEYILPTATSTTLGGIKVGQRLSINNGVLSADVQSNNYSLPTASTTTLGGIKVGSGLTISSGVLSVVGGGGGGSTVAWGTESGGYIPLTVEGESKSVALSGHTHIWSSITGKPSTFAPSAHSHIISDVTGLQTALDGKAASSHTHAWGDITSKPSTFAPSAHTHSASDITSGTFAIARIPTGTTSATVALGNHLHTGVYEPVFSKNEAFNKNFGTTSGTVAQGNDSRIVNGQTAYGWGNHASAGYALNSALTAHINNDDNPHAVTTAQIGAVDLTTTQTITGAKTFSSLLTASAGINTPKVDFGNGFTIEPSGTELVFKYNGVIKQRMLSDGTILATGGITALST